jgi:hypothetical protein
MLLDGETPRAGDLTVHRAIVELELRLLASFEGEPTNDADADADDLRSSSSIFRLTAIIISFHEDSASRILSQLS